MKKVLLGVLGLVILFFVYAAATYDGRQTDCCAEDPDEMPEAKTITPELSDEELAALVPDYIDAQSMSWLSGSWAKSDLLCDSNFGDGFIHFYVEDGWMMGRSEPEQTSDSYEQTRGRVSLNPGQDNDIYITPPKWENAYWRVKPQSKALLKITEWDFKSETTDWREGRSFELVKCP